MLAVGGWADSLGDTYSRMASSAASRSKFAETAVEFLERYGFDGLQMDWQYPVCWQADCSKGPASDRANYVQLVQDLKKTLDKKGLKLGINVAGYAGLADLAFDAAQLAGSADFITVPAYDFHGSWEAITGHTAPLSGDGSDNVEASMKYWTGKGVPAKKLLMGIPFYGQSFTLAKKATTSRDAAIGVMARGAGSPGPSTQQAGMLAYFEICPLVRKGVWTEENGALAPFAYRGNQWVGYDNVDSVRRKAEHIKAQGYGGAMIWAVDMDDFNNLCCSESFPLTKAIARVLGVRDDKQPTPGSDCQRPSAPVTPPSTTFTTGYDSGEGSTVSTTPHVHVTESTTTRSTTSTTTTTTTTKAPAPPTAPSVVEASCEEGKYYEDKKDCAAFYRCVNGEKLKNKCSPGLLWNSAVSLCDWAENVKCKSIFKETPRG